MKTRVALGILFFLAFKTSVATAGCYKEKPVTCHGKCPKGFSATGSECTKDPAKEGWQVCVSNPNAMVNCSKTDAQGNQTTQGSLKCEKITSKSNPCKNHPKPAPAPAPQPQEK